MAARSAQVLAILAAHAHTHTPTAVSCRVYQGQHTKQALSGCTFSSPRSMTGMHYSRNILSAKGSPCTLPTVREAVIMSTQVGRGTVQSGAGAREEQLLAAQVDASPNRVPSGVGLCIVVHAHHVQLLAIISAVAIAVGL